MSLPTPLLPGALAAAAIAAAALLAAPPAPPGEAPVRLLAKASGELVLTNSRAGKAIVGASGMLPGESVSGTVRIGNAGFERPRLELVARRIRGTPGPHGGDLADALRIRVERLGVKGSTGAGGSNETIYRGPLKKMGRQSLGRLGPFKGHRYQVAVTLPNSGPPPSATTGDNAYQGSLATLDLVWRAR